MTADPRAALVEAVAQAISNAWDSEQRIFAAADAAIDLIRAEVLEEAARVADSYHRVVETKRDLFEDGNVTVTKGHSLADPRKIAAAIRALKVTPSTT